MRKILLFTMVTVFGLGLIAQERAVVKKELRNKAVKEQLAVKGMDDPIQMTPGHSQKSVLAEDVVGSTWYDLQTNRGMQTRTYLHDDGTLGTVWTMGPEGSPSGPDRGTGYNYFDANNWGTPPTEAIEDAAQAGWPSYAPWGESGEAYVCHDYYEGTILGTRAEKGTGDWNLVIQAGPSGAEDISFPRIATLGADNSVIHILSTTWVAYNNQESALLYARTYDGGVSWDIENQLFDELGEDYSTDIGPDVYNWAMPKGDVLAFVIGDNWQDLCIMKSIDGGDSWEKSLIWECPFPLNTGEPTDTFYCPDGSFGTAIDMDGKVHVAFSLTRALEDGSGPSYFPGVDGVVYWNEDRPSFSNDINALNPYGHEDSELIEDYSLIGWSQDLDNNGSIDILDEWGYYNTGLSSQPQITVDDQNRIFVVYSSVTEGFDNGIGNFRHLWARASTNGGEWWGGFHDLNEGLQYVFDECVFPSMSPTSDDFIYLSYQADNEPGSSDNGVSAIENFMRVMTVEKVTLISGVEENEQLIHSENVSQNYPNPFTNTSSVYVVLDKSAELSLEVSNLMGQVVYTLPAQKFGTGKAELTISAQNLETGVYFYTVRSGEQAVTRKMIVE